ncbi:MAG: hypothetical protein Salg2KO_02010 [Salibacteraceae bacterium]
MAILKVTISDNLLDRVLEFLNQFKGKGIEVEHLDNSFEEHKKYVQEQLELMDSGQVNFMTLDELNQKLEETIRKCED